VKVPANGSLNELPLRSLIVLADENRWSGALAVKAPDGQAHFDFLFGHLFHATSGDRAGWDAVSYAGRWPEGEFTTDSKAQRPANKSIEAMSSWIVANLPAPVFAQAPTEASPVPPPSSALPPPIIPAESPDGKHLWDGQSWRPVGDEIAK
jgi:Domain of unknown function (DUF4388)